MQQIDRRLSVAPMMDWTDRHCRFFHRLLSPHVFLYTEMVHANAIIHGDAQRHLQFSPQEHKLALQLGGSDPEMLARAINIADTFHYDEYNLNCGCPSDRVQSGQFGACLMDEPDRVADCIAAMQDATTKPVTVKTRLGIDDRDSYEFLVKFITTIHERSGCSIFYLHARKAWLKGLSPKENRTIPALDWERVYQVKKDFPHFEIIINGGFEKTDEIMAQFDHVDGVMIGRRAYHVPYDLAHWEQALYGTALPSRADIVKQMIAYIEREQAKDVFAKHVTRHMMGLFHAQPLATAWKHALHDAAQTNSTAPLELFAE
ncbi:MAG TPA: tRNA dihydrouridine(20/20a) synthase DusA [Alphaproteobacteria bacterium]